MHVKGIEQGLRSHATACGYLSLAGKEGTHEEIVMAQRHLNVASSRIAELTPCYGEALIAHGKRVTSKERERVE